MHSSIKVFVYLYFAFAYPASTLGIPPSSSMFLLAPLQSTVLFFSCQLLITYDIISHSSTDACAQLSLAKPQREWLRVESHGLYGLFETSKMCPCPYLDWPYAWSKALLYVIAVHCTMQCRHSTCVCTCVYVENHAESPYTLMQCCLSNCPHYTNPCLHIIQEIVPNLENSSTSSCLDFQSIPPCHDH